MNWTKILKNRKLTKKDHGRTIKIGKRGFIKVWIKGEYPFWEDGFEDINWIGDTPIYLKEGIWYKEII